MVSTEGRIEKRKLVYMGALVTRGHLLGEVWGAEVLHAANNRSGPGATCEHTGTRGMGLLSWSSQ